MLGERARALIVGGPPDLSTPGRHMVSQPIEQGRADSEPTGIGMHTRRDEASTLHVRAPCHPRTYDLAVQRRDDHEPVGCCARGTPARPRGLVWDDARLTRLQPSKSASSLLSNFDHPDLFNFPCFFA